MRRLLCLLIEDSQVQARVIAQMLGKRNLDVLTAFNLSSAKATLKGEPVDFVLSDLVLPDCQDGSAVSALKEIKPSIIVAAMSAGGGKAGGTMKALATARHEGAEFLLPKPFDDARLAGVLDEVERRVRTGTRTQHVLVVDDSRIVRTICSRALTEAGMRVTEAESLTQALGTLDILDLDAVVTDVHMPGLNAIEAMPELRERLPGVALITMSGDGGSAAGRDTALRQALEAGAHMALPKPFKADELVLAVRKGCALAASELLALIAAEAA